MKSKIILAIAIITGLFAVSSSVCTAKDNKENAGKVLELTQDEFAKIVFDYKLDKNEWKYLGKKPAIVDFWAPWCGPCRRVAPILDELAADYKGKIVIYKVNVDNAKELSKALGIRSIPTFLMINKKGDVKTNVGAVPKEQFKTMIDTYLLGK